MDLQKIVREHEEAAATRAAAEKAALEQKQSAEDALHKMHAEKITEALKNVVGFVLAEGARQLKALDYECEIIESLHTDADRKIKKFSLKIDLFVSGKKLLPENGKKPVYQLNYSGDVEAFTISAYANYDGRSRGILDADGLAVSKVTTDLVEKHLEHFTSEALRWESEISSTP